MNVEGSNTGRCPEIHTDTALRCRRYVGHLGRHFARKVRNDEARNLMYSVPGVSWD